MSSPKNTDLIYKVIADEAMMAFVFFNSSRHLVYANRLAEDLLEFSLGGKSHEVDVEHLFATTPSQRRIRCLSAEVLEMQGLVQDVLVQKLNGQTFIANLGIKHIDLDGDRHVLLMIQDVTLQKKLQREINEKQSAIQEAYQGLLHQNQKLKELDVAKDRFIAMTTHELRTPVSAIVASSEILKLKLYDTDQQHDEFVGMLYEQGNHLLHLVNDVLDFAKIQAGRMEYYVEERDLAAVLKSEVEGLQSLAKSGHVQVNVVESPAPVMCYFDELRTRQVIVNLLNNAISYNKPQGKVVAEISQTDDFVNLTVTDTGIGIAHENYEKIFNEFETLGAIANHSKGTGLGLPISLKITRRMGGNITVQSEIGKGSVFTFSIPKKRVLPDDDYRSRPHSTSDLAA
jgi:signal transduction histidine kinase